MSCSFDQWLVMVVEKMLQRTWGIVPFPTDIPKDAFEDKVRQSVLFARLEFQAALLAAEAHLRQSHQDAALMASGFAEPETIATFFPSNMILGPSNMILYDTDCPTTQLDGTDLEDSD